MEQSVASSAEVRLDSFVPFTPSERERRLLAARTRIVVAIEAAFAMDPALRQHRLLERVWALIEEDRRLRQSFDQPGDTPTSA